jgi:glycosyltransferase involved in cell wall biosynthesis
VDAWLNFDRGREDSIISENYRDFRLLVAKAQHYLRLGKYDMAAIYGEAAAVYACCRHPGIFSCGELEEILDAVGASSVPLPPSLQERNQPSTVTRVLHVCANVRSVGGHSRFLLRWMSQDRARCHSLALLDQISEKIPQELSDGVQASGGKIHHVNAFGGSILKRARDLSVWGLASDVVVLHDAIADVTPIIAFANLRNFVPVIRIDHADHLFWLGAKTSTVVASLRESAARLAQARRHVAAERNVLLPTLIEPSARTFEKNEAKQRIGIPEDSVLLLSVARRPKYTTINGISYADAHVPILKRYPRATLIVVGSGDREDWANAISLTNGRIICYAERPDVDVFYQAADIYLDSYPFVSITSLLEAGTYGLPLVSLFPHASVSEILGADMPGLNGNLLRARSHSEYTMQLSALIEDPGYRARLGEATRAKILSLHTGARWQECLEELYQRALKLACVPNCKIIDDRPMLTEPDVIIPRVFGQNVDADQIIRSKLSLMPRKEKIFYLISFAISKGLSKKAVVDILECVLPELLSFLRNIRYELFSRQRAF